jgi:peptidoglycan hydrolase CwlO-like protein
MKFRFIDTLEIYYNNIMTHLHEMEKRIMTANQDHLNKLASDLQTALTNIQNEIASLKAQPGAEQLDFSALDNEVAQASGIAPAVSQAAGSSSDSGSSSSTGSSDSTGTPAQSDGDSGQAPTS